MILLEKILYRTMRTPFSVPNPAQCYPTNTFPFPHSITVLAHLTLTTSYLGSRAPYIPSKADVHISGVCCKFLPLGVDAGRGSIIAAYIYIIDPQVMQFKPSYGSSCSVTTYGASLAPFRGDAVTTFGFATFQVGSLRDLLGSNPV